MISEESIHQYLIDNLGAKNAIIDIIVIVTFIVVVVGGGVVVVGVASVIVITLMFFTSFTIIGYCLFCLNLTVNVI